MKEWLYFYIEYTIKNGSAFYKESGWALNHKSNFIELIKNKS